MPQDALSDRSPADMPTPPQAAAGYFGKVATHGDFVGNRLDRALRDGVDEWLRRSVRASQEVMGERWLSAFLVAPVWRFVWSANVCGPDPVVGVMMPSVDRVGRYFPLVILLPLPHHRGPALRLAAETTWFEEAERLARSSLGHDFRLAQFDEALRLLAPIGRNGAGHDGEATSSTDAPTALWWTRGTVGVAPLAMASTHLPQAADFTAFLCGLSDDASSFQAVELFAAQTPAVSEDEAETPAFASVDLTGAAHTHRGLKARVQADAFFAAPSGDIFAVADGVADDAPSRRAAHLAVDGLREVFEPFALNDLLADVKGRLGRAHAMLHASGSVSAGAAASIAALLAKGERYAVVWAGDTRCYILQAGTLRLLTRDHVETGLRRHLTRTVGGDGPLTLSVVDGPLGAGDRFVILTGALARFHEPRRLAEIVAGDDPEDAARALVEDALIAGMPSNVTAMVVHTTATSAKP